MMSTQSSSATPAASDNIGWLSLFMAPSRAERRVDSAGPLADAAMEALAERFAAPLLSSQAPAELDGRIDETLDDEEFGPAFRRLTALCIDSLEAAPVELTNPTVASSWVDLLGRQNADKLERVLRVVVELAPATMRLRKQPQVRAAWARVQTEPLLAFLEDWHMSARDKQILMDLFRAEMCMLALFAMRKQGKPRASWFIPNILAIAERGYVNYLRLIAAFPEAEVSLSVVPADQRYELSSLTETRTRSELSTQLLMLKHSQLGQPVLSPFEDIEAGDE